MVRVDPERRRKMAELSAWHAEWARKWGIDDYAYENDSLESWQSRIPPEAEAEYRRRADQIMGIDPTTGRRQVDQAPADQPLPPPRSRDEALFYLGLQPCERCGNLDTTWSSALTEADGALVRRYAGTCDVCGQARELRFQLPATATPRPPEDGIWYGGEEPSALIDAGQWLRMSDVVAQSARERAATDATTAAHHAAMAVAFVREVLKFLPPGATTIPESAIWTAAGASVYERDPRRFTARRLNQLLDMLRAEFPGAGAGEPPPGRPPLARGSAEIHLYLDMHPCECGEVAFDRSRRIEERNDDLMARYEASCPRCGRERRFSFRLPAEPVATGPEGSQFRYGGLPASELLDPGEWLAAADGLSASVAALGGSAGPDERERFRFAVGRAAAAIDEVMKFAAPGATEVPASAFWTERGRALHRAEPGRFRLDRLDAVRSAYRRLLAEAGLE